VVIWGVLSSSDRWINGRWLNDLPIQLDAAFSWFLGFFVCCFIMDALIGGTMTDNHGSATRRGSPIRYWLKVGFWSAAYLFAVMFPVGYALQERGRELQGPPETKLPASASLLAVPSQ